MREVAAEQPGDGVEDAGRTYCPEARTWEAVGHALGPPRCRGVALERSCKRRSVLLWATGADRLGCEPGRNEGLVDPVARQRVDEPRRVADQKDVSPCHF